MVAQMTGLVKTLIHIMLAFPQAGTVMTGKVTVTVRVTVTVVDSGLTTDYTYEGPK